MKKLIYASLVSIVMIAVGICLLIYPVEFITWACYIIGALSIIIAALKFFFAYRNSSLKNEIFTCLCFLVVGILLCVIQQKVAEVLPLITGICLLVYGFLKLYGSFTFKKQDETVFKKLAISSGISIVLSIIIILCRNLDAEIIFRIIGAILMYNAADNIFSCVIVKDEPKELIEARSEDAE